MTDVNKALRDELVFQLNSGHAHAPFEEVVRKFPAEQRGAKIEGMPYSAWQLLEHIRLAQRDILEFSTNEDGHYREPAWPDDYWPKDAAPPASDSWDKSIAAIERDREALCELVQDAHHDLFAPFPWGSGQTLLREALVVVDHNAYHLGELIAVRRALKIWPPK